VINYSNTFHKNLERDIVIKVGKHFIRNKNRFALCESLTVSEWLWLTDGSIRGNVTYNDGVKVYLDNVNNDNMVRWRHISE